MFFIEVHDEEFQTWLNSLETRIQVMRQTLLDIGHMVEMQGRKFVPVDTTRLEMSYRSYLDSGEGFIEIQMGYSALDPRDNYDYADYIHTGIDYRTGEPLNFQKTGAEAQYLYKAIDMAEAEGFKEIKTDYLSLFKG